MNFNCDIREECLRSDYNKLRKMFNSHVDIGFFNRQKKENCDDKIPKKRKKIKVGDVIKNV